MIVSKTPLRISFFGGGTDFPQYFNNIETKVIGSTIDKFVYSTSNFYNSISNINIKLFYSKVEQIKNINDIKHRVVKELLKKFNLKKNLEFHFISDLPSFSGLGSSSSFSVGLSNLLFSLKGQKINQKYLAKFVIDFERNHLKEHVGLQDQIFASYGGFNTIFLKNNSFEVRKIKKNNDIKNIENNSFIVNTKIFRKAENIEKKKINNIKKNLIYLDGIRKIADDAYKCLISNSLSECFADFMKESWSLKKNLHRDVTNKEIDDLYSFGLSIGATCGKLLGAGSGGFLYFYVPEKNQKKFKKRLNDAIKINFTNTGSQIIRI
jgi:D-glycero-alpha-D-manno-heptose-7-phosphate kinase